MKKKLHYTVVIEVDDHGDCNPAAIGEGIDIGIAKAIKDGMLLPMDDTSTIVERVTPCFSHEESTTGGFIPEIHRTLFASTAHLMAENNEAMLVNGDIGIIYDDVHYGYLIRVPTQGEDPESEETLSADLQSLIASARAHQCKYIRLDQDADVLPGVPTYSW